jgi:leucyl/phenylalanyl-tRNA--protein transferase
MPIFRLPKDIIFPDPDFADPDGLLAIGGDLSEARLLEAYRQGIFPWYSGNEPLLWWSPAPRLIIVPEEFHLPKRLARTIRNNTFTVTINTAFSETIHQCGTTRLRSGEGTWITDAMKDAYNKMHRLGYCHSIECWQDGKLVGGLYGLRLGRVFFGESMFSTVSNSSKVALAKLVEICRKQNIAMIDCQMTTRHLLQFGAKEITRTEFRENLNKFINTMAPYQMIEDRTARYPLSSDT